VATQPFDLSGAALLGLALAELLTAVSESEQWGWSSSRLWGLLAASTALLGVWIRQELRASAPLVDLRLMGHHAVRTANVSGLPAGIAIYMMTSLVVRFVQTPSTTGYGLGASLVVGGLVLLPISPASLVAGKLAGAAARHTSPDRVLASGTLTFAAALLLFATARDHLWETLVAMGLAGLGVGCLFAILPRMIRRGPRFGLGA
jgi:hypothetical protein